MERHPAVVGIRVVGPRLENSRGGGGVTRVPEFDPFTFAVTGRARAAGGRSARDERFLRCGTTEISVGQAIHEMEGKTIEVIRSDCRRRLRNAIAIVLRGRVIDARRRNDTDRRNHSHVSVMAGVAPHVTLDAGGVGSVCELSVGPKNKLGFTRWRRNETIEIRRQKSGPNTAPVLGQVGRELARGQTLDHLISFENVDACSFGEKTRACSVENVSGSYNNRPAKRPCAGSPRNWCRRSGSESVEIYAPVASEVSETATH